MRWGSELLQGLISHETSLPGSNRPVHSVRPYLTQSAEEEGTE